MHAAQGEEGEGARAMTDPTTPQQEALVILMEECAEVQQVAAKALRFGIDHVAPDKPVPPNRAILAAEIGDVAAMVHVLVRDGLIDCALISSDDPASGNVFVYEQAIDRKNNLNRRDTPEAPPHGG